MVMLAFLQLSRASLSNYDLSASQSLSPPLTESHLVHGFEHKGAGRHIILKSEPALLYPALEQA